jgi:hypothetical protein
LKAFREWEHGNGNEIIFAGMGMREREQNIFDGNGNAGMGTTFPFTGMGTGNGNRKKSFPQDTTAATEGLYLTLMFIIKISCSGRL